MEEQVRKTITAPVQGAGVRRKPARLNFAGYCLWCGCRDCESRRCMRRHAASRWLVCEECGGEESNLCGCLFGVVEAWGSDSGRFELAELTIRVYELDVEVHGPGAARYEATIATDHEVACASGPSPSDAVRQLVTASTAECVSPDLDVELCALVEVDERDGAGAPPAEAA